MSAKLLVLTLGIVVILSGTAYFTIHGAGSSPAVAERQAEVTVEPPATGAFSGLARSRDGHLLATVNDHKTIELWDDRSGQSLRVLETSDKEWTYSPTFSPDGSLLVTPSSTAFESSVHLLFRGSGWVAWMFPPGRYAARASTLQERCSLSPDTQRFTLWTRPLENSSAKRKWNTLRTGPYKPWSSMRTETCWPPQSAMARWKCGRCRI